MDTVQIHVSHGMQDEIGVNIKLGLTFKYSKEQVKAMITICILLSPSQLSSDTKQH